MRTGKHHQLLSLLLTLLHRFDHLGETCLCNLCTTIQQQLEGIVAHNLPRTDLLLKLIGEVGRFHCQRIALAKIGQIHLRIGSQILIAAHRRHLHLHRVDGRKQLIEPLFGALSIEGTELIILMFKVEGKVERLQLRHRGDQFLVGNKGKLCLGGLQNCFHLLTFAQADFQLAIRIEGGTVDKFLRRRTHTVRCIRGDQHGHLGQLLLRLLAFVRLTASCQKEQSAHGCRDHPNRCG